MKKPEGCITPKRDREEYNLTVHDLKFMIDQADKINAMLSYYINMPENLTGELAVSFRNDKNYDLFPALAGKIEEIQDTLNNINWR